ncbi:AAA family ATPase [Nocardiopsis exhalans]|uniref:AAA family ATPase n=1 Tax=Nocardiopsis exhalans TaxID=163604 RepID=A0ABY5D161_9ACTN|nr:AAA family ATPase [Nocardiopsis exhalans]USY17451.1 AAA family ATPase [Nocardiopsis exhalans]
MYLCQLELKGFRSLADETVTLRPGVTVLVGENNAGKSNVMDAIRHLTAPLDGRRDIHLRADDLHRDGCSEGHHDSCRTEIGLSARYTSKEPSDLALYGSALAEDGKSIVYHLAYTPPATGAQRGKLTWQAGDAVTTDRDPEPAARERIRHLYLPPLRDAQRELASASSRYLHGFIGGFLLDEKEVDSFLGDVGERFGQITELEPLTQAADSVRERLVELTQGAHTQDTGFGFSRPTLPTVARSLRLRLEEQGMGLQEISESGHGYANLLFMATLFAQLRNAAEADLTLLLVEEPEAHLHPQLQSILMDHLQEEAERSQQADTSGKEWLGRIQVVVTTHAPHIATSVPPEDLVVLQRRTTPLLPSLGEMTTSAPVQEKKHHTTAVAVRNLNMGARELGKVRQYLNATRSTMLFSPRVLLVEGIAEGILVPAFGKLVLDPVAQRRLRGTAVVPIDGVDFAPYLKVLLKRDKISGQRIGQRVAVITDGDFHATSDGPVPDRRKNLNALLEELSADGDVAQVFANETTLEPELMRAAESNTEILKKAWICQRPRAGENDWRELMGLPDEEQDEKFAKMFNKYKVRKGDFAQDLLAVSAQEDVPLVVPGYFERALTWITEGVTGGC